MICFNQSSKGICLNHRKLSQQNLAILFHLRKAHLILGTFKVYFSFALEVLKITSCMKIKLAGIDLKNKASRNFESSPIKDVPFLNKVLETCFAVMFSCGLMVKHA